MQRLEHEEIEQLYEDLKDLIHSMRDKLSPSLDVASFEASDVGRTHLSVMLLNCNGIHRPSDFERALQEWKPGTTLYSERVSSDYRYSVEVPITYKEGHAHHRGRRRDLKRHDSGGQNSLMWYTMGMVVSAAFLMYKIKVGEAPEVMLNLF